MKRNKKYIFPGLIACCLLLVPPAARSESASEALAAARDTPMRVELASSFSYEDQNELLLRLSENETLLNTVFVVAAIVFGLFLVIFYRMAVTKRIVSIQNKKLSSQQSELENAKAELTKALKQEKAIRERLEKTYENLKLTQAQLIHVEKMSSLGQLTAGIAHEMNNPMGFIKGGVQNLKLTIDDLYAVIDSYEAINTDNPLMVKEKLEHCKAECKELLAETKESIAQLFKDTLFGTERVTEIVNGLRVFSRHDEAKIKNSDIVENLESALMILKHKCKNRVEIVKQFDPNIRYIDCFPGQLNQVFINLISNAIDALGDSGTLIISTHDLSDKIQLSFKDNGCGIPDDIRDKIFDPFFSTKEVGEGTGLGLSISYSIIEQHKGKIEVFSKVGVGTEFRITLFKRLNIEEEGHITGHEAENVEGEGLWQREVMAR